MHAVLFGWFGFEQIAFDAFWEHPEATFTRPEIYLWAANDVATWRRHTVQYIRIQ